MEIENTISQFRYKRKLEKDRLGTAKKTKERLGLASRQAEDSKKLYSSPEAQKKV
jgi:hypothetical protein